MMTPRTARVTRCVSWCLLGLLFVVLPPSAVLAEQGLLFPNPVLTGIQQPLSVVSADFDGDGRSDLAVFHQNSPVSAGEIRIYLGNGDGTFRARPGIPLGTSE